MDSINKLKQAFANAFDIAQDQRERIESMAYGEVAGRDSTAHMVLIAEIEAAFDDHAETDDVIGLSSFSKAKEIVAKYGVKFDSDERAASIQAH